MTDGQSVRRLRSLRGQTGGRGESAVPVADREAAWLRRPRQPRARSAPESRSAEPTRRARRQETSGTLRRDPPHRARRYARPGPTPLCSDGPNEPVPPLHEARSAGERWLGGRCGPTRGRAPVRTRPRRRARAPIRPPPGFGAPTSSKVFRLYPTRCAPDQADEEFRIGPVRPAAAGQSDAIQPIRSRTSAFSFNPLPRRARYASSRLDSIVPELRTFVEEPDEVADLAALIRRSVQGLRPGPAPMRRLAPV